MEKLQNTGYVNIYNEYEHFLKSAGYNKRTGKIYALYILEFLRHLESRHINDLRHITPEDIRAYYHYLSHRPNKIYPGALSPKTVSNSLWAITVLFNYYEQRGLLRNNPISGLSFPCSKNPCRSILTQSEIKLLYQTTKTLRERALLGMYYGCGLRKTEGEELDINDLRYNDSLLYVKSGKGNKRRVVPMSPQVRNDFSNYYYYERNDYIKYPLPDEKKSPFMLNKRGGRMRGMTANEILSAMIKRTGDTNMEAKKICIHGLRHSIATHLLENGLAIEYIRDFLGHQKLETTQIYTRVGAQQLQQIR